MNSFENVLEKINKLETCNDIDELKRKIAFFNKVIEINKSEEYNYFKEHIINKSKLFREVAEIRLEQLNSTQEGK